MSHPATSLPPPTPAAPPNLIMFVLAGVLSFLLWLAVAVQLLVLVPRCERLFSDFRMKLPMVTERVIRDSRWAVPAVALATLIVCLALGRRSHWPWLVLLLLLPLVVNVLVGASLLIPYMELLTALDGGGKK